MKITKEWMEEKGACREGIDWVISCDETDPIKLVEIAIKTKDNDILSYANWGLTRIMTHKQCIQYAVFAARQVLEMYESKYPEDKRPRLAIEAAEKCIEHNTKENRAAAWAASDAAWAARAAAWAASDAARAASDAARAAWAARAAASDAARAARAAASDAMKIRILEFGIKLIGG